MKKIKIFNLDRFCKDLFRKYKNCKTMPNNRAWIADYYNNYKKAKLVREKIESMSSDIKEQGVFGKTYTVSVNTLEEYFNLYNLLKTIPESEIKISSPRRIYIQEENNDFYQVE